MRGWRYTTALLLAALWLPAVLHCQLEAAEVDILTHDHDSPAVDHQHDTGNEGEHHAFADTPVSLTKHATKLLPPATLSWAIVPPDSVFPAGDSTTALSPEHHPPPYRLSAGWQFVTRAAPPVRAPSLNG